VHHALQGPFSRSDILDWLEGGFFPASLPIRAAQDPPDAPFRPLNTLLHAWQGGHALPPGFAGQVTCPLRGRSICTSALAWLW
jgi:hypothetical protein